jgi:hypothetical protein
VSYINSVRVSGMLKSGGSVTVGQCNGENPSDPQPCTVPLTARDTIDTVGGQVLWNSSVRKEPRLSQ